MKTLIASSLLAGLVASVSAFAAAPADAPAGTMGMCKDGTFSSNPEKKGACGGHQGVKEWYGTATPATATITSTTNPPAASSTTTTTRSSTTTMGGRLAPAPLSEAAGGAPGQVWVNTATKVYHCSGDKWYGKTKVGSYMSEPEAKNKGFHGDHGKGCA
jgi:hypothetical protein